jgi:hypothetical protein
MSQPAGTKCPAGLWTPLVTLSSVVYANTSGNDGAVGDGGGSNDGGDRRYGTGCLDCAAGYAPSPNAGSSLVCLPCPNSTFKAYPGSQECSTCGAGTLSAAIGANSSSTCKACAPGKFGIQSTCILCPAGTYSAKSGVLACTSCGAGNSVRDAEGMEVLEKGGGVGCSSCTLGPPAPLRLDEVYWKQPGITCVWRCPDNFFKWKRDAHFEVCVACPLQSEGESVKGELLGGLSTRDGAQYTCRCPIAFPVLRVFVYSDPSSMVPVPVRAMCGLLDGWVDIRREIPKTDLYARSIHFFVDKADFSEFLQDSSSPHRPFWVFYCDIFIFCTAEAASLVL